MTSAASPAASPRAPYARYRHSPGLAPTRQPAPSQPAASPSNGQVATPSVNAAVTSSPRTRSRPQYTDAGTQYSPDGLPPTAPASKEDATVVRNKRKQSSPSPQPLPQQSATTTGLPGAPPPENAPHEPTSLSSGESIGTSIPDGQRATAATEGLKKARTSSKPIKIMPRKYETCDAKDLGFLIADMLMELIRLNDKIPLKDGKLTRFHSRAPPGISCHDYLNRLIQHATLSPPILLSMVYYIDKLCAMYPAFTIGSLTVHRFLITAATVAAKGLSDSFWTNSTYARIGGISTGELATLELDFLQRVEFRIVPQPEALVDYYYSLVQRSPDYQLEEETIDADVMDEDPT